MTVCVCVLRRGEGGVVLEFTVLERERERERERESLGFNILEREREREGPSD